MLLMVAKGDLAALKAGPAFERERAPKVKNTERPKADDKYAELRRRDMSILGDIEKASKIRVEKSAKLRELRLQKEAEERRAAKEPAKPPVKAKASRAPRRSRSA